MPMGSKPARRPGAGQAWMEGPAGGSSKATADTSSSTSDGSDTSSSASSPGTGDVGTGTGAGTSGTEGTAGSEGTLQWATCTDPKATDPSLQCATLTVPLARTADG